MIQTIRVTTTTIRDPKEIELEKKFKKIIPNLNEFRLVKIYRLQDVSINDAKIISEKLFCENLTQRYTLNKTIFNSDFSFEIIYKPGVMNPEVSSIIKASKDLGINLGLADSSYEYHFFGKINKSKIKNLIPEFNLFNPTIEKIQNEKITNLKIKDSYHKTKKIQLTNLSEKELIELSEQRHLYLSIDELNAIVNYFKSIKKQPTDLELEIFAQTWSEHCLHKTFKSELLINSVKKKSLFLRIKSTNKKNDKRILSAFHDNSGVIDFYDGYGICAKVETHNSPSAIEPYGGAMTGSGGVFRDIAGTGTGAKVLVSTDIFCLGPYDLKPSHVPPGCLHPGYILKRVVDGVRDYGNRVGIPTNNGSFHFHKDFRAKPTVAVGAYGLINKKNILKKKLNKDDLIITLGGKTGRDGIHGSTFSSSHMDDKTKDNLSSAVQIGNAIEEKRILDSINVLAEKNLIKSITDCGAGGYSSAIGEMGKDTGVEVYLEKVPLKYKGLSPWEIFMSESQERMVICIDPKDLNKVIDICSIYNSELSVIGKITGNKILKVFYKNELICDLDLDFLFNGYPKKILVGRNKPKKEIVNNKRTKKTDIYSLTNKIISHPNVCSKEPVVRLYDHNVKGNNAMHPYSGVDLDGPNNASIIKPFLDKPYGLVVSHGLNPILNNIDPYSGAIWAATEAVSNYITTGARVDDSALIDNFIFPAIDEEVLYDLDRAVDGLVDFSKYFDIPFVSGKDSLSSTYKFPSGKVLKIPPVVLISVFGKIDQVENTASSDFKSKDSLILLVGKPDYSSMGGSVYSEILNINSDRVPKIDFKETKKIFNTLPKLIVKNIIKSVHDISEGGLFVALAEMSFGSGIGVDINIKDLESKKNENILFNETPGCFVIEILDIKDLIHFKNLPHIIIGRTSESKSIKINRGNKKLIDRQIEDLKKSWKKPFKKLF